MTQQLEQLTALINDDFKSIESLQTLLDKEKDILIKRDFSLLDELSEQKQLLIETIQSNNGKKISLLSSFSDSKDPSKLLSAHSTMMNYITH